MASKIPDLELAVLRAELDARAAAEGILKSKPVRSEWGNSEVGDSETALLPDRDHRLTNWTAEEVFRELELRQKALYGEDDRVEAILASVDRQAMAASVAAMFFVDDITFDGEYTKVPTKSLAEKFNDKGRPLCPREPFRTQPASAKGTGFLVTDRHVLTAGHCVSSNSAHTRRFLFGYDVSVEGIPRTAFHPDQVYGVSRVIGWELNKRGADWALVELDRPVVGVAPLVLDTEDRVAEGDDVFVIGHPAGLPKKVAGNAQVRDDTNSTHFVANLDTYAGNSGSPVFSKITGRVVGILVRGERDFAPVGTCMASLACPVTGCRGEDCTRITHLPHNLLDDLGTT